MDKYDSYIDKLKLFAIFSVVCAHVGAVNEETNMANALVSNLLGSIGTMGVPVFFIISGYLFNKNSKSFKDFWAGRFISVMMPWIFCETGLWLFVVLRKGGISVINWIKFIVGYQSTTYYLTLLVVFYFVFWKVKSKPTILMITGIVSVMQLICTGWNIHPVAEWGQAFGTLYLNPFHFMIYFVVGILLGEYNIWNYFGELCLKYLPLSFGGVLLIIGVHIRMKWDYSYFSKYALINIIFSTMTIMGVSYYLDKKQWNVLDIVGKWSFSIYLLHQYIAGFIVWLTKPIDLWMVTLCRPFITIACVMLGILVLLKLNEITQGKFSVLMLLIGGRWSNQ